MKPIINCEHTCNGLCNALDVVAEREQQTLQLYGAYRDECSYEDVRELLNELILTHSRSHQLLEQTREVLRARCEVADQIRVGFGG